MFINVIKLLIIRPNIGWGFGVLISREIIKLNKVLMD